MLLINWKFFSTKILFTSSYVDLPIRSGPVSQQIYLVFSKANIPNTISFLRLNPDWYESKKKELERLHENLVTGRITIVDVYSAWNGARKAVVEFSRNSQCHLLSMIDIDARIGVKGR